METLRSFLCTQSHIIEMAQSAESRYEKEWKKESKFIQQLEYDVIKTMKCHFKCVAALNLWRARVKCVYRLCLIPWLLAISIVRDEVRISRRQNKIHEKLKFMCNCSHQIQLIWQTFEESDKHIFRCHFTLCLCMSVRFYRFYFIHHFAK